MDNNREWPIAPTFLSLRQGCTEDTANYNTDGIYYTDYIRGFLADLSHDKNIQNALSIFQFVPKNFLPHDPNAENPNEITTNPDKATVILNDPLNPKIKETLDRQNKIIIRIDSGTYVNNGRLCDAFRKSHSDNTSFCFMQDSIVGIFADEKLSELNPYTDEYRQRLEALVDWFNQGREKISRINYDILEMFGKTRRFYIHYTCPFSLFEEHIFPIYVQGRIIACLMLGQMARDSFTDNGSFAKHRIEMIKVDRDCPDYLSVIESLDSDKWNKKAQTIVNRIEILEKRLEDRIDRRNIRYINKAFEQIEKDFWEKVKKISIKSHDAVSQFTEALNRAFYNIKEKFDHSEDGFIRMFALPIDIKHEKLVPIGWSGAKFDAQDDFTFDIKQLKDIDILTTEQQRNQIKESASLKFKIIYDNKKDILLPGWLAGNEIAYIVWKRHDKNLKKQTNTFNTYKQALRNFYSIALECYSYIRGAKMELLLETTIQESAHESAHFILPAINVVENNLEAAPIDMISPKFSDWSDTYKGLIEKNETEILESLNQIRSSSPVFSPDLQNNTPLFKLKKLLRNWVKECHEIFYSKLQKKYNAYNSDTYMKYKAEVLESLNQLREINYGSSLIFSSDLQINKSPVQVFDLLYKLKKTLNKRALDGHKNIYYYQSENYVTANIDAKYLNHALYNLLDNAIKYGYEGSYIRINMDINKKDNMLIIEIVSYGIGIEPGDRLYQLFERSEEAEKIAKGTGIGLYIVKKICEAHGGTISHNSERLSDYNIPALFNYKYRNTLANKCSYGEIDKYEKELRKLSNSIEYEVVSDRRFISYARVFSESICEPTYRNTYCISIPLK